MSQDAGVIRKSDFEGRFHALFAAYMQHVRALLGPSASTVEPMTRELLDEYAIVITKRLEGTLVSTEEALPLTPHDLAQLIPALAARLKAARDARTRRGKDRTNDIVYTERLLARAREMLASYGPEQKGDVLWPVIRR